jgi:predicted transcriptional regulator
MVAREQQMIAVVDGEIGRRIEIGAATAARLLRRLVDLNLVTCIRKPHGGGKAGDSGANDVNGFLHQMKA